MPTLTENMGSGPGDVWVLIKVEGTHFQYYRNILESLVEYITMSNLGEIDGESIGVGAIDINFMVSNKEQVAIILYQFLQENYKELEFHVSDHYEAIFEE